MKRLLYIVLGLLLTIHFTISAQLESSKWVFGNGVGVDFVSGHPISFTGSKMRTTEGCSSVSDFKGNLLFYTDGVSVWNKNNELMPNGKNLNGSFSSTQSAIIVPLPGSKTLYYIFTMDWEANKGGFCYSIVDISKELGLGDVTLKNQLINEHCTEKLVAVKHQNNKDVWIIIHEYLSDTFLAYLLTKNGVELKPVISKAGIIYTKSIYNTIGYLKLSNDRKKLGVAVNGDRTVEVFDFDQKTGNISNPLTIKFEVGFNPYGIEFSPNSDLFYIGLVSKGLLYQLNLKAGDQAAILKSKILIGRAAPEKIFGALQLGSDGKIYVAEYQSKYLSVIENPNNIGSSCSFKSNVIYLSNNNCMLGLPVFFQEYVKPPASSLVPTVITTTTKTQKTQNYDNITEPNKKYTLSNVYFDFNKADLRSSSTAELQQLIEQLNKNIKLNIEIIGHTDSIGNEQYNNKLSFSRANEIGNYLTKKGIDKSRITISYKGSTEPVATNSSETGRQKNRRVEFILRNNTLTTK